MNFALAVATSPVISPLLLVALCALAGIGTVFLIPSRREKAVRKIGGTIVLVAGVILASNLIHFAARQMDPMGVYFWFFSAVGLFGALRVVTHTRPVYSAIYFVLTVFSSAGLFVLLWAEFMAAALILIYAGAILVTYIFVIMLAARAGGGGELSEADQASREPIAASAIGFGLMAVLLYVIFDKAPAVAPQAVAASAPVYGDLTVTGLARYLFSHQLVNLELAGVLLTLAMVGAIVIARRRLWNPQGIGREEAPGFEIGDDNPHGIPVAGEANPQPKAYPET